MKQFLRERVDKDNNYAILFICEQLVRKRVTFYFGD